MRSGVIWSLAMGLVCSISGAYDIKLSESLDAESSAELHWPGLATWLWTGAWIWLVAWVWLAGWVCLAALVRLAALVWLVA